MRRRNVNARQRDEQFNLRDTIDRHGRFDLFILATAR